MARYSGRYLDPEGDRFGLPTYPWGAAPLGLATRRQLRARGLCPGGRPMAAQVMWVRYGTEQVAYLYDVATSRPKRTATRAVLVAIGKAIAARRVCGTCRRDAGYVIPGRYGECLDCAVRSGQLPPTAGDSMPAAARPLPAVPAGRPAGGPPVAWEVAS